MKIDLLLDKLKDVKVSRLDDAIDRVNYIWTPFFLVIFCFVIGAQQTFSEPLTCMVPANFEGSWENYVNHYCYINGTFHTNSGQDLDRDKQRESIEYYQWIPYTLAVQALSFVLPHLLYLTLTEIVLSGFKFKKAVNRCADISSKKTEELMEEVEDVAFSVYDYTCLPDRLAKHRSLGRGLALSYLLHKAINLFVVLANIYFVNTFVGLGNPYWAFNIFARALSGPGQQSNAYFPRVTYCEMAFKVVGQNQTKMFQCLLMLNIIIEKIYVMIYFWMLAMAVVTLANLVWVVFELLGTRTPAIYRFAKPYFDDDKNALDAFLHEYMSLDGRLLIRFIQEHAGRQVAAKVVTELAEYWKVKPMGKFDRSKKKAAPPDDDKPKSLEHDEMNNVPLNEDGVRQRMVQEPSASGQQDYSDV